MTSPNTSPQTPSQQHPNRRYIWLCRTLAAVGVSLAGFGIFGYVGLNSWINQELPLLVETELSKILKRKVNVGEVKSWKLTGIKIGNSSIPATAKDTDYVTVKAINVSFDPIFALVYRTLPVSITFIKPEVYLEENKQGEWIDKDILMQEEGEELPVKLDATVRFQDAKIVLLPQEQKIPFQTQVNGFVNYNQTQPQLVKYDINGDIAQGNVEIKGETEIETGKTEAKVEVKKLNLTEFSNFIPGDIASISQGNLNANLQVDLPSFSQIPSIQGKVRLENLQAKTKELPLPIIANALVNFEGQKIRFENTKGSYGNLNVLVSGDVDLNQGFNLQVNTNAVNIANLVKTLPIKLPIGIDGKLQAQMFLRGDLINPVLIGNIANKEELQIEKTSLTNLQATFVANTSQVLLQNFRVVPAAGGEIKARGNAVFVNAKTGKIDFNQAGLAFDINAELPNPEAIITPYGVSQQVVKLATITADGKIRGTVAKPLANITWNLPNANISSVGEVAGVGEIILAGNQLAIKNTVLKTTKGQLNVSGRGNLARKTWQASINANSFPLHPFLSQVKLGEKPINEPIILDKGEVKLAGRLDNFDLANIQASADLNLDVTQGKVIVNSRVNRGIFKATANARQIAINKLLPNLPLPLNVVNSQVDISGSVQQLLSFNDIEDLDSFQVVASGNLATPASKGKGRINFNGRSNLASKTWQAAINANSLPLNPVISQLNLTDLPLNQPLSVNQGNINLAGRLDNLDINNIQAVAKLNLNASNGKILVDSRLNQGIVNTQASARGIALGKFISDLPLPVNVVNSRVDFSSPINQLIALDFNKINANATANLAIAKGTVHTTAKLQNGILSSNINAANINSSLICRSLAYSCPQLSNLFGKLSLVGDINPFLQGNSPATIETKTASLKIGEQSLNAEGKIYLNPVSNQEIPWDVGTELNIIANSNLAKLPLKHIAISGNKPEVTVNGEAKFQGRLEGKNLLSAPFDTGNLQLIGDLRLRNFAVDNIDFQPLLTGTLNIDLGRDIAIDLQGETDKIAAQLQPCNRQECLFPYLPVAFELKQGTSNKAILLSGKRQGDTLDVKIQNLSLALLNAVPIVRENIPGSIAGIATGEVDINLFNLATAGNINIKSPDLGYIKAKDFAAKFTYDGEVAKVSSAFLELGESQYNFQGKLNLKSGDIDGRVAANSARLQDIITAVNIPLIENLFANSKPTNYGNAADVETQPVGNPQGTIFSQLRLLSAVRNNLQKLVAQKSTEQQFNPLSITGSYNTKIIIAGKLTDPTVDFQLEGNNWLWGSQTDLTPVKPSNYPEKNTNQELNINKIIAKGNFKDGVVNLQPVQANFADGRIAFQGQLALEGISGNLDVNNLPIATVQRFIELPVDIGGNLNLQANLGGSLFNPQVPQGQISLVNGKIQEQSLEEIAGNFSYTDSIFQFNTTPTSSIQLQASIPYPPQADVNQSVSINTKFGAELLAFLTPLTQGQLEWVKGDGEIEFKVEGALNWQAKTPPEFLQNTTATSTILLENATIKTQQLEGNIDFNIAGNFALTNDRVEVEKLEGNVAGSPFLVTGTLPLFQSIPNPSNPFTIAVGPGKLNLQGLYKGKIDANVIVSQTVMNPVINGQLRLNDGRVYLPKQQSEAIATPVKAEGEKTETGDNKLAVVPRFEDFKIILDDFKFKQSLPRINFRIAGELTLNGLLNDLQPQGTLKLERGTINLADNSFLLTRDNPQRIEFVPQQGILNPNINIQLQTTVVDAPRFDRPQAVGSEIRDDVITSPNPEQIDVQITIKGRAKQLLSSWNRTSSDCQQNQTNTLLTTVGSVPKTSPQVLEDIATCVNTNSKVSLQNKQWLSNPGIELTSMPNRNKIEILALLGNRAISSALEIEKKLTEGKEAELLESAVVDYVFTPIITEVSQEFFWRLQKPVDDVGEKIGLSHLQVFPSLEGVKQINQNSSTRFIYDYNDSQFRLMYETRF